MKLSPAEIASSANRAREALRTQVGALAVAGAERLIRREIDASADNGGARESGKFSAVGTDSGRLARC